MQRATFDLLGIKADGAVDERKWLRHGAWPADAYPLRKDFVQPHRQRDTRRLSVHPGRRRRRARNSGRPDPRRHHRAGPFPFLHHRRPHAALEQRLGYTHKGRKSASRAWT
jgi:hypothetical protein